MKTTLAALLAILLTLGLAHAEEEALEEDLVEQLEEAQGQPIDTLQQAVDALQLRNDLLDVLMQKEELTDGDLAIIQQLTETIENALAKVEEEVGIMRERVQEVRAGAEKQGQEDIRESGREYLDQVRTLMQ
ncbi:DUF6746 family protein [Billgrantia sp. Q4P2]|uniref:DUF6746 family protein n=1 Tax=Billgrantia sp. Q4P2 TaxID=3463857 RepID=UPI004056852E